MAELSSAAATGPSSVGPVGVVGLGAMGSRMAHRLLDGGRDVVVWNRTPAKATRLIALGARVTASPAEVAAQAGTVIAMVSGPEALVAVTSGRDGIASGLGRGAQLIVMSTVGLDALIRLASVLPPGVDLLDAPVLGSIAEAERGQLHIFVGAEDHAVARATALLSLLGTPVHVGGFGAGTAAKLVANSTLFGVLGVLGEALALADALGLTRETTFDVLSSTPLAEQARRRRASLEAGEFPARFRLSLARKDADLTLAAAASAGQDLRLVPAARSWLAEAERFGAGEKDYTAMLGTILGTGRQGEHHAG